VLARTAWRERLPLADEGPIWEALRGYALPEADNDRRVLRRDAFFRRLLAVVDAVAATLALVVAVSLVSPGLTVLPAVVLLPPLVVLLNKAVGVYDRDEHLLRKTTIDEVPQILHTAFLFAVVVWLGESIFVSGGLTRAAVFALVGTAFAATVIGRAAARSLALALTPPERCLVLGSQSSATRVAERLGSARGVNAHVIGRIALGPVTRTAEPDPLLVGHVNSLAALLSEHAVERVVIAPDGHDQEEILQAIRLVKALGVKVSVLPRLLEVVGSSALFDEVDGITLLGVRRYGLSHSSEFLKRAVDIVVAAGCLLAVAPLLVALAVAIKLDSRGPVLFRQPRIGRNGRGFGMLKFRSMVNDAEVMKDDLRALNEAEGIFKIKDDPRITRVGRFLRRTSLDELPQLLTVLKGDMSLVGPRPLVPDEDAMIEGWQRRRLAVKPGMTGLWQIFGSARIPMREMVKIDYLYGANWSLWLDLKILFRTVPYILSRRGQ
jgi:exopolysaccharide biosynthesis polyprenyl glycosylphosphotransferase